MPPFLEHLMGYNPPLIFGPVPPESNPPITPEYYQPSVFTIAAIGLGAMTLVTTSVNHNYVIGQLTRLLIPQPNGSTQLNELTSYVIAIPAANQVLLGLNSLGANAFVASTPDVQYQPQIVAVGDVNSGPINTGRIGNTTYIPGSFINISPQ